MPVQDASTKQDEDAVNDALTLPFMMGMADFLNELAKRTKHGGSAAEAFAELEDMDLHLGKWKNDMGMVCDGAHIMSIPHSERCCLGLHFNEGKSTFNFKALMVVLAHRPW